MRKSRHCRGPLPLDLFSGLEELTAPSAASLPAEDPFFSHAPTGTVDLPTADSLQSQAPPVLVYLPNLIPEICPFLVHPAKTTYTPCSLRAPQARRPSQAMMQPWRTARGGRRSRAVWGMRGERKRRPTPKNPWPSGHPHSRQCNQAPC